MWKRIFFFRIIPHCYLFNYRLPQQLPKPTLQHELYEYKQVIIRYSGLGPQGLHEFVDQHAAHQQLVSVAAEDARAHHRQLRDHRQLQHKVLHSVADDLRYRLQDALGRKESSEAKTRFETSS